MENEFYRFEFKYEMSPVLARQMENEIKKYGMEPDKRAENGEYHVTSLYFDSHGLNDYYEKSWGLLKRKKLRARIYEPLLKKSEVIWLELKRKHDMKIHKKRLALSPYEWRDFLEKGPGQLLKVNSGKKSIKEELLWNFLAAPVKPAALVRYIRKPYALNDLRITFDRNIETCKAKSLNYTEIMAPVKNKGIIMELKFAYILPYWLKKIIEKYNLRRDAFSKYSNSIDAIYRHDPLPR